MTDQITIKNARLHNLKNVTLSFPKNKLVVFTGLSGSGKSTLAFDILHKEGQRQYMESLGFVTDTAGKPPVDGIVGLSPTISVDQHLTNRSPRSTVGTATEVYTYLRVLFARVGHRPCPVCGREVPPSLDISSLEDWDEGIGEDGVGGTELDSGSSYPCPHCGAPVPELDMANFSFNKPDGACPTCTGLGVVYEANLEQLMNVELSIPEGAVYEWEQFHIDRHLQTLQAAARYYGFTFDANLPIKDYGPVQRDLLLYGVESPQFHRRFPDKELPEIVRKGRFEGVVTNVLRRHAEHANDPNYLEKMENFLHRQVCPDCQGARLRPESRQVQVAGRTIVEISSLSLKDLSIWVSSLPEHLLPAEAEVAEPVVVDLRDRIRRLLDVGIGYLTLERPSASLSAGEAQRLRLASLLGSGLTGVLYVLDEPTIGLHPRDNVMLVQVLRKLRDLGNTVLMIEHDLSMVSAADWVVDFGPGAGRGGGQVIAAGAPQAVAAVPESATGRYLIGTDTIPVPAQRRPLNGKYLTIRGARAHNLKDITVRLPLGMLVAVTGVSGSGKSSLMLDILDLAARQRFYQASESPGEHDYIDGWEHLDKIITIDQTPIGHTTRSNAATYTQAFSAIRQAFASTPEAAERELTARHFSFNVPGGRCERCEGAGLLTISMHFMSDVFVRCPVCHGRRFKREVLAVKYGGYNIAEVLEMSIEEALRLFSNVPAAASRLSLMVDVGMGYLQLGQPATTLSGGEAQRVKLAKELSRRATGRTLYLLDEPTTGLHPDDIAHLLIVLQRLVDAGNSVIVIEHNLDLIKVSDWVIDLGPEGGDAGGQVVAEGTPEQIAQAENSYTGAFLRDLLVLA